MEFWEDKEHRILKTEIFSKLADDEAKAASKEKIKDKKGNEKQTNNYSQIRKFYDEIMIHKTYLMLKPEKDRSDIFKQRIPYIKMMNAKLAYSNARGYIGDKFHAMLKGCINSIEDIDDFYAFSDFFEAFIAFYRQYNDK